MRPAAILIEMESSLKTIWQALLAFVKSRNEGAKRDSGLGSNKPRGSRRDTGFGCLVLVSF